MTQLDIPLNFLIDILANCTNRNQQKLTAIVKSLYQLQNMAYIRVLGVRFSTRWILVSSNLLEKSAWNSKFRAASKLTIEGRMPVHYV